MFDKKALESLADQILEQHSFKYKTFSDARLSISIKSQHSVNYTFDRLSLCVYSDNLDTESRNYLYRILSKRYCQYPREDQKMREEYAVLNQFMRLYKRLSSYKIEKEVRPDFVLTGKETVGVEVVRLTTHQDGVLAAISRENFGLGKTAAEIKQSAIAKHGEKATHYSYWNLGNATAIGRNNINISEEKVFYAQEIIRKFKLYEEKLREFDEFIVLCDAQRSVALLTEEDVDEVVSIAGQMDGRIDKLNICILYSDTSGQLKLKEYIKGQSKL